VDPGSVVAGAVAEDRVRRQVLAEPHHDRAEVDGAGLLGRYFAPGEILGMRSRRLGLPAWCWRRRKLGQRRRKARRAGLDREMRLVDAADLLGPGVDVDELGTRHRHVEEAVALRS